MPVENQGNLVTRRAFAQRDGTRLYRIELLADITQRSGSLAYKMTEDMGLFGSGSPSPLYIVCELIRALEEVEQREGARFSSALEMAGYPLRFLRALRTDRGVEIDAGAKLNFLVKAAADANCLLNGRGLGDLTLGEHKEFRELMMNAGTLADELALVTEVRIDEAESSFKGAPVVRERVLKVAHGDD